MKKATIIVVGCVLMMGVSYRAGTAAGGSVPKVLTLGSLSKVYEPVPFNHEEHVSNAGGCADCHHQHGAVQVNACSECHRIDPADFKKNVKTGALKPCGECHPATARAGDVGRPELKAAYHQACFKCHRGEVGSVGKDPKGCVEMCHTPKAQTKPEKSR